jgi:hypothetical protein
LNVYKKKREKEYKNEKKRKQKNPKQDYHPLFKRGSSSLSMLHYS